MVLALFLIKLLFKLCLEFSVWCLSSSFLICFCLKLIISSLSLSISSITSLNGAILEHFDQSHLLFSLLSHLK